MNRDIHREIQELDEECFEASKFALTERVPFGRLDIAENILAQFFSVLEQFQNKYKPENLPDWHIVSKAADKAEKVKRNILASWNKFSDQNHPPIEQTSSFIQLNAAHAMKKAEKVSEIVAHWK